MVGVTTATEVPVHAVVAWLKELGAGSVGELDGIPERVTFPMSKALSG